MAEPVLPTPQAQAAGEITPVLCPVCACAIGPDPVLCPRCNTPHHADCWQYTGGCAIFGCDSRGWLTRDPARHAALERRIRWWTRFFWWQWKAFVMATLGLACALTAAVVVPIVGGMPPAGLPAGILGFIAGAGLFAAAVGAFAWVCLVPPSVVTQSLLESKLGTSLAMPPRGGRTVLDELGADPARERLRVWRWRGAIVVACITLLAGLAATAQGGLTNGVAAATSALCVTAMSALSLLAALSGAFSARYAFVKSVENRLIASWEAAKKG